jgi:hypothetical protein
VRGKFQELRNRLHRMPEVNWTCRVLFGMDCICRHFCVCSFAFSSVVSITLSVITTLKIRVYKSILGQIDHNSALQYSSSPVSIASRLARTPEPPLALAHESLCTGKRCGGLVERLQVV